MTAHSGPNEARYEGARTALSSASEAALTGHANQPELVLGKIIHIDEGGQSADCANCGLPSGTPFVVVTAEMEKDIAYFCSTFSATVKKTMQKDTQFIGASGFDNQGLRNV